MTTVVRSQKRLTDDFVAKLPATTQQVAPSEPVSKHNAIFAIHGISPTQRYAFQDQVAATLQCYLNAQEELTKTTRSWKGVVHWPKAAKEHEDAVRPSALRLYRDDDSPENPTGTIYDVYEGYWSPFSKGKTNITSALRWLLNATFLGTSSTANIPCTRQKLLSDLGYVGMLLVIATLALVIGLSFGFWAWVLLFRLAPPATHPTYWQVLQNPLAAALTLPLLAWVEFAVDVAAAYVLAQIIVVYRVNSARNARTRELLNDASGQRFTAQTLTANAFHRWALWALWGTFVILVAIAFAFAALEGPFTVAGAALVAVYSAIVVASVALFQFARSIADFAVENVLGDVQIYTTHDNNSTFYSIRQQIVQAVTNALTGVLNAVDPQSLNKPYYDAIHIFGHSLGSTVGMDALILLRQMVQENTIADEQWKRIRSFTTFGTSLEKTRFFFDVRQPTINAAQDQWENDVYGRFFTNTGAALSGPDNTAGIYWSNHWYFQDIVANEIVSYTSDVPAGNAFRWSPTTREICKNYQLPHKRPRLAWVHSDYLADPLFWADVGPVICR